MPKKKRNEALFICANDLVDALEFYTEHDRFYKEWFAENPFEAICGMLDNGFIHGIVVSKEGE